MTFESVGFQPDAPDAPIPIQSRGAATDRSKLVANCRRSATGVRFGYRLDLGLKPKAEQMPSLRDCSLEASPDQPRGTFDLQLAYSTTVG
ncbi:hypothetical protein RBSWK_00922 [Rhodopirellula baltica SWK14]|uniref:Uncharacterized protein n=1 Tax=Rhodopirellula baltica SWK14 TaxID=993516 RepID=L7CMS0_RHOBT|nr:hypothetical protein RBSWK_00922 [Rhodopirellula baltica SWK14]